ncbi:MAG: phage tail protein [Defluviitaleaceae bacterium]|nr:phage tail protein [Defluviitaleaceae bacterium]
MANVGTLGNIVFSASSRKISTIDDITWSNSAQYASHNRHLRATLLEFTGTDAGSISFTMYFSVFMGVDPMTEITKLLNALRDGEAMRLVIGTRAFGRHKWVITRVSKTLERFDRSWSFNCCRRKRIPQRVRDTEELTMGFLVTADGNMVNNLAPATLVDEISQNISTILLTPKGSVPLDRNFGTSWQFISRNTPAAESMIVSDILDAVEEYEPRAEILSITFDTNEMTGQIIPRLEVSIRADSQ